ncbi:MAG: P-loop NTPase fold protein, partial [Crocosphaera sp.]
DRLTKEEMRQMFQLVKGLANFPNTIYLLSFDPAVVTEALKDVQTGDGVKYLEKIIQVPFTVPEISRIELDSYFHTQVYNIISQNSEIDETLDQNFISKNNNDEIVINSIYWKKICSFYKFLTYFEDIREINRFLNIFRFEYDFIGNEVNTIDLVVLSAIKSQDNHLYEFIRNNKDFFSSGDKTYNSEGQEAYKERLKKLYIEKKRDFQKIEVIEAVLRVIFPKFNRFLGQEFPLLYNIMIYQAEEVLQKHRKIGHSEIFDTFFQLSVPNHKIPYTTIKSIIELQDQPQLFAGKVKELIEQDKTQELFEELNIYLQEFREEYKKDLIKILFPFDYLIDFNEIGKFSNKEYFSLFIKKLLESSNINLNSFLIELENENIEGVYFLCVLLYDYARKNNFDDGQRNFIRENINNSEHGDTFKKLEQLIDKRLQKKADDSALQIDLNLAYYLYTWKRINYEATRNYVNQLLETQKGIIHYFTGGLSYSPSNGERKAVIPQNYITYFTEIEPLINKVQNIKDDQSLFNQLPEKSQLAILTFLEQFSNNNQ